MSPRALAAPAILPFLLLRTARPITIEDAKRPDGDIDADEYLWDKLPGRCCFMVKEICPWPDAPRELCEKEAPTTCAECDVWAEPDNMCHTSAENCMQCGMKLYCGVPPPLADANKVCTGDSHVGMGCFDAANTGLCASKGLPDCQDRCRRCACAVLSRVRVTRLRASILPPRRLSRRHTPCRVQITLLPRFANTGL